MARVNPAGQWLDMLPEVAEAQATGGGMFGPAIRRSRAAQAERIARENDMWAKGMAPAPEGFQGMMAGVLRGDDPGAVQQVLAETASAGLGGGLGSRVAQGAKRFFDPKASASDVGIFAGQKARTADLDALAEAKRLTESGAGRDDVWYQTGWMKGPDGKWKFEISDDAATFKGQGDRLGDVMEHADLEAAYPWAPRVGVEQTQAPGARGSFRVEGGQPRMRLRDDVADVSVPVHETSHAVQAVEGFGYGGTPKAMAGRVSEARDRLLSAATQTEREAARQAMDALGGEGVATAADPAYEAYRRLLGEADARLAQKRQPLTWAERRARPPWRDYDVPEDELIVK